MATDATPPAPPCFRLAGVSKTYRLPSGRPVQALRGAAVDIPAGGVVAVLGHSGSGKSTLLHLLGLLDAPDPGSRIEYWDGGGWVGYDRLRPPAAAGLRHRHFGFVFQDNHLLGHLDCAGNVALALTLAGVPAAARRARAAELLGALGMSKYLRNLPRQLSGGEAQRVAVLRAIAHSPRVVLADEPTGNLDAANAALVLDLLTQWQRGGGPADPRTLILVTHDVATAFRHADHFLILGRGEVHGARLWSRAGLRSAGPGGGVPAAVPAGPLPAGAGAIDSAEALLRVLTESAPERDGRSGSALPAFPPVGAGRRVRWPDLLSLAVRDLFRAEHRPAIAATLLILFFLTVLAVVGCSLQSAQGLLVRANVDHPMMRALPVNALGGDGVITPELADSLRGLRLADGRPVADPDSGGVRLWNTAHELFHQGDREPGRLADRRSVGRTVEPGDPYLNHVVDRATGRPVAFSGNYAAEIVVTTKFLREVADAGPSAGTVWIEYQNRPVPLRVVGVVDGLRGADQFLLPDGFYQTLNNGTYVTDPFVGFVNLAPLPADRAAQAAELLQTHFDDEGLPLTAAAEGGQLKVACAGGRSWPLALFRERAAAWLGMLEKAGVAGAAAAEVQVPPQPPADPGPVRHGMATVYVGRLEDMEEAAAKVEGLGLGVDRDLLGLIRLVVHTVRPLARMLWWFVALTLAVAALNLLVTVGRRVWEQRAEVGILKAAGMTTPDLLRLYGLEGLLVGLLVAVPAGLLAVYVRRAVSGLVRGLVAAPGGGPDLDPTATAAVLLLVALLCPLACAAAAAFTARRRPAELVG